MGSIQIIKSAFSPVPASGMRELSWCSSDFDSMRCRSRVLSFRRRSGIVEGKRVRVYCKFKEADSSQSNGEEPPESLFMKELRKRGITPTSLLEESNRTKLDELNEKEVDRGSATRNAVSPDFGRNLTNQREQSMALNSEGLEGLIPRAKLLLRLGGTFFLAFWPLILVTIGVFSAVYLYFGPSFVHDGSRTNITPPQYVDPYTLLQEGRITQ